MKPKHATHADVALAQRGDRKALERVVRGMEGLCWYVARGYLKRTHLEADELAQEARMAVLRAVKSFNPAKGMKFSNYAVRWMQALLGRLVSAQQRAAIGRSRRRADQVVARHFSLDAPVRDDGATLAEFMGDDAPTAEEQLAQLEHAGRIFELTFTTLRAHEGDVVRRRADGETLQEIADSMALSRERIRQIQTKATAKLRRSIDLRRLA